MNDFTKDELETFYLWLHDVPDQHDWSENCDRTRYYRNLSIKLKNMIDNYCEHESDYAISQDTNPPVINMHCKKCGEFYR